MNQAQLQAFVEKQMGQGHIHNAIIGIQSRDGRTNAVAAAGFADSAKAIPMQADTPYFIASVTKMYTATVIMKLVERGQLDLDETAYNYLPHEMLDGIHFYKGQDYSARIKVYHLLNQTSGLADYFEGKPRGSHSVMQDLQAGGDFAVNLDKITDIVRQIPSSFEPGAKNGTRAHYSDTNYQLLGAIIESITGQTVAQNFQQFIFEPLGLQHTYVYDLNHRRDDGQPATIYFKKRALNLPLFMSTTPADGGIVSTAAESLAFLRTFFEGRLFEYSALERMTRQWNALFFPIQYGWGLMRFKLPRAMSPFQPTPEFIGHSGSSGSFAFYAPDKDVYLAGTLNQVNAQSKPFQWMMQIVNKLK